MSAILSTLARVLTLPVSLVCGIVSARLVIAEAGVAEYALLSLLVALPSLMSFSDLGAGAVVVGTTATSASPRSDTLLRDQVTSVARVTLLFAAGVALADGVMLATGAWEVVLGDAAEVPGAPVAAAACVLLFCVTICLGVWQRLLLGLGRNFVVILLQGLISPISLLVVWLLISAGDPRLHSVLAGGTFIASLVVAVAGILVADRMTRPLLRDVARRVLRPRRHPGARVMHVGWPMLAQLLAAPLSVALPRFILAQTASAAQLAQYALAGQVFFALQALIGAAGVTLWPAFAKARASGRVTMGPFRLAALFGACAAAASVVALAIGPWFFGFVSDGAVDVGSDVILAFGAMITAQAVLYPIGMFIMDPVGIRFQVVPALGAAAATIALTIVLAPTLGPAGPLLANAAAVVCIQIIPFSVHIRRRRGELYGGGGSAPEAPVSDA